MENSETNSLTESELIELLELNQIAYQRFDHPAVFTSEAARAALPDVPGRELKNLFLRDAKGARHLLVAVDPDRKTDLKALAAVLGVSNLSFASAERLQRYLGLTPGAVTLLGLVNDRERKVELVIDREVWSGDLFHCHPLVNTATLVIGKEGLERFFALTGHAIKIIDQA